MTIWSCTARLTDRSCWVTGASNFDGRGGTVSGTVQGGLGSDIDIIGRSDVDPIEGVGTLQSFDSVKISATFAVQVNLEHLVLLGQRPV